MKGQGTEIWKKEEYSYEGAHGFNSGDGQLYAMEDDKIHPAMIVVPEVDTGGFHCIDKHKYIIICLVKIHGNQMCFCP